MFYSILAKQIHYFKETEGGRSIMCKAVDELAEKRKFNAMLDVMKNLMETMKLSVEQAMDFVMRSGMKFTSFFFTRKIYFDRIVSGKYDKFNMEME